jgi:hypothetical protein
MDHFAEQLTDKKNLIPDESFFEKKNRIFLFFFVDWIDRNCRAAVMVKPDGYPFYCSPPPPWEQALCS